MLRILGQPGKDLCDRHLGVTRRDVLRVGGSSVLGLGLAQMMGLKAAQAASEPAGGGPGWNRAKSIIWSITGRSQPPRISGIRRMTLPDNVRSVFKRSASKVPAWT
ncbi:MAG: hypothetical protein R3C99_21005 [Pirellulaceae bacterium]